MPAEPPLTCASCGPEIPARILVLHPGLEQIAVPLCGLGGHGANDADRDDVVQLGTPEADEALQRHAVASGYVVTRPGG